MIATPVWGTSSSILEYHKESQDNYYQKEGDLGEWQGKAAESLGFSGTIKKEDLENALLGKNSSGEQILNKIIIDKEDGTRKRAGLDLTFNAPKSVSIAYEMAIATGNEELANTILKIHNSSVSKVLNKIEDNYSQTRETIRGVTEHKDTKNLAIAKFQHDTARPVRDENDKVTVDPSLHTHAVIMNISKSKDGTYKAIESKKIFENYISAGTEYRAIMSYELNKAGFEINITDQNKGFYEIGLTGNTEKDEEVIENFSQRASQIKEALPELREKYPNKSETELKQMAAHRTREWKGEIDRDDVREKNFKRAEELGLNKDNINSLNEKIIKNKDVDIEKNKEDEFRFAKHAIETSIKALTDEKSVFKKEEIIQQAQKMTLSKVAVDILESAFKNQFKEKTDEKLIDLSRNNFTTTGILDTEKKILDSLKTQKKVNQIYTQIEAKDNLKNYSINQKNKTGYELTKGQKEAAKLILSSKESIVGIQGDAGTGKTTMLKAVSDLNINTKIIGLSYTGKAAAEIEKATQEKQKETSSKMIFNQSGIKSSTIASFLNKIDSNKIDIKEFENAKLVVDEASMLGVKDTNKLIEFAQTAKAQLVLIGDVKQFKAISAGDTFQLLQDNNMKTCNMNEVLRQTDKTLIKAVKELNQYDSNKAFETLDSKGNITEIKEEKDVLNKITNEYFKTDSKDTLAIAAAKDTYKNNLILTQTNEIKETINDIIHNKSIEKGLISKEEILLKVRESTKLTPSQKYFASNYEKSSHIFLQDNVFIKNNENQKISKLKKGSEFKITNINKKNNSLIVEDDYKNKFEISLKENSRSLQAYKEENKSFSENEKIVFEKNDKQLNVSNGTTGIIKGIDKNGNLKIKTDDNKMISFNSNKYNYFNRGYAVTSYKAQGQTSKNVIAYMPAKYQNFNSFYVAATRAEESLKIFTDSKEDLKSMIFNEQIKDNATSLNERLDNKEAAEKEEMLLNYEERKISRQKAFENAPTGDKQLGFAQNIAKELKLDLKELKLDTRIGADTFIKENIEKYEKSINEKTPTNKQLGFAQVIAKNLYKDIDTSKMNVKETKDFINNNIKKFKEVQKNKTDFLLTVDSSNLSEKQQDNYFKDLTRAEMISAYKKDIDTLEVLNEKHESEFPQIHFEEKEIKIELFATALDIKKEDYIEAMFEKFISPAFEDKEFGKQITNTPLKMSNFIKEFGSELNYKDEKSIILSELIVEKHLDYLMNLTNTSEEELTKRSNDVINLTTEFQEQLVETREYEKIIDVIEEKISDSNIYSASKIIEENRELLQEHDLNFYENQVDNMINNQIDNIDYEKDFEKQEQENVKENEDFEKEDLEIEEEKFDSAKYEEPENEKIDEEFEEMIEALKDEEMEKSEEEIEYER